MTTPLNPYPTRGVHREKILTGSLFSSVFVRRAGIRHVRPRPWKVWTLDSQGTADTLLKVSQQTRVRYEIRVTGLDFDTRELLQWKPDAPLDCYVWATANICDEGGSALFQLHFCTAASMKR